MRVPDQRRVGLGASPRGQGSQRRIHHGGGVQLRHDRSEILLPSAAFEELRRTNDTPRTVAHGVSSRRSGYFRSNRSLFITLTHAATKSSTNLSWASSWA